MSVGGMGLDPFYGTTFNMALRTLIYTIPHICVKCQKEDMFQFEDKTQISINEGLGLCVVQEI